MIDPFIRNAIVANSIHQSHSGSTRLFAQSWQKNQSTKQKQKISFTFISIHLFISFSFGVEVAVVFKKNFFFFIFFILAVSRGGVNFNEEPEQEPNH